MGPYKNNLGNTSNSSDKKSNDHSRTDDEHEFITYPRFLFQKKRYHQGQCGYHIFRAFVYPCYGPYSTIARRRVLLFWHSNFKRPELFDFKGHG